MNNMISVVLIDDHPLAINGIGSWLNGTGRFEVSGTAKSLAEAAALMEQLENLPEIIILDISLGPENGLDFIPMLKKFARKEKPPFRTFWYARCTKIHFWYSRP